MDQNRHANIFSNWVKDFTITPTQICLLLTGICQNLSIGLIKTWTETNNNPLDYNEAVFTLAKMAALGMGVERETFLKRM